MQNRLKIVPVAASGVWEGSNQAWRLLDALAPTLLHQAIVTIPGGLRLLETGLTVLTDAEASGILEHPPQANTALVADGPYGLCADLWMFDGGSRQRLHAACPWIDPMSGSLWFFRKHVTPPFVQLSLDGIHSFSAIPANDVLMVEQGFDSVRLRAHALRPIF